MMDNGFFPEEREKWGNERAEGFGRKEGFLAEDLNIIIESQSRDR